MESAEKTISSMNDTYHFALNKKADKNEVKNYISAMNGKIVAITGDLEDYSNIKTQYFTAHLKVPYGSVGTPALFETTAGNINLIDGQFICEEDGIYFLQFSVMKAYAGKIGGAYLSLNGTIICNTFTSFSKISFKSSASYHVMFSCGVVTSITKGQKVTVNGHYAKGIDHSVNKYSTFMGFRISGI